MAGKPRKAQSGETVGLANRAEADSAVVKIASGGKARARMVFEFAIDLIGEDVDVVFCREIEDAAKDLGRHQQSSGIVRRVDIQGAGVGANQGFQSGQIVGPVVF